MDVSMLLMLVLPYFLYVFIDHKYGMKAGIVTALMIVVGLGIFIFTKTGKLDELFYVDAGFILMLGGLSIALKDSKWFKLQPTIVGVIISIYVLYLQYWDVPIMVRYLDTMEAFSSDPQTMRVFKSPGGIEFLSYVSRDMVPVFSLHAALNAIAALKLSNVLWLLVRVSILPMLVGFMVAEVITRSHLLGM